MCRLLDLEEVLHLQMVVDNGCEVVDTGDNEVVLVFESLRQVLVRSLHFSALVLRVIGLIVHVKLAEDAVFVFQAANLVSLLRHLELGGLKLGPGPL